MRIALVFALLLSLPTGSAAQAGKAAFDEGMRLMRLNKADAAEKQFERAIAADPTNGNYHLWLGNAVGQQAGSASVIRQPFMARRIKAEFERAVALDPELLDARDGLIQFYLMAPGVMGGSAAKAREQQREIAKRNTFRGQLAAATVAWADKDTAGTERALRAAIAAQPDSARTVISLAQRQVGWGRVPAAFGTLDDFLARHPGDIAVRFQIGRLAANSGQQLERGEKLLRELVAEPEWESTNLRPSRAAVHYRLGMVLEKSGKKPDARAAYERAVALDPQLKPAKDALAALR
ncbi:MAG: tetratricopeptide repeat protein [Gemmatimonadetes bacterium]|nr:tetratricopeptide repeat protein [Gemmatimonadota bacterium]